MFSRSLEGLGVEPDSLDCERRKCEEDLAGGLPALENKLREPYVNSDFRFFYFTVPYHLPD
jgi:hypothetical protein